MAEDRANLGALREATSLSEQGRRRDPFRRAVPTLVAAELWSVLLFALAFVVPVYQSGRMTDDHIEVQTSTLTAHEGWAGIAIALIPLAVTSLVAVLLMMRARSSDGPFAIIAWCVVALLALLSLSSLASIGVALLPIAVLLAVSVHRSSRPPRPD